jgi:hypothetical protein
MHQNIKYELGEIDRIINEGERKADFKRTTINSLDEQLRIEVERIKKTLIHEVFTFEDERHLERYIQFHQSVLIGLLDKLDRSSQVKSVRQEFFKLVYTHVDQILRFIERHFAKYFDQDAKAPDGYLSLASKDAQESMDLLGKSFTDRNADEKIVFLLLHVLQNIVDSVSDRDITFRQVMYAKEMRKELFRLLERKPTRDLNEELRQIMYYLNYNSVKVITYHAHYISALVDSAETRTEKIEKLSWVLKNISQAQVKPEIRYNQQAPALKDQLMEFITVEMEYQERLQRLNAPASQRPDSPLSGFKLKFEASLAQLAYLIKIFLETKLISNNNLTHILQFLAASAITKRSETISFTSFRTKFYNVELGTKQSVRGMLTSMIHYIDKS